MADSSSNQTQLSFSDEVVAAVDSGHKIAAIKILRQETGMHLKEAKHAIDALARERQKDPQVAARLAEEGGAGGLIKMVVIIVVILGIYFYYFAN